MRIRRSRLIAVSALFPLLLVGSATASQASTPDTGACSQAPSVVVNQSDPNFSYITISLACQSTTHFHRIVSAAVAGTEILSVDTLTDIISDAASTTKIKLPKALVCVTNPDTGAQNCV
jgi:tetrahydromethanopterin S-methyltransferase subunit E